MLTRPLHCPENLHKSVVNPLPPIKHGTSPLMMFLKPFPIEIFSWALSVTFLIPTF